MALRRPWTQHLLQLVDSGVTHAEELIRLTTPLVPMGHAFRKREMVNGHARERHREAGHPSAPTPRRPREPIDVHRIGARLVLRDCLHGLVRTGHLVQDGEHFRRPSQATVADVRPDVIAQENVATNHLEETFE